MLNTNSMSPADIAAVTGGNGGFADGNGWWVLIILFALFGGFGNNYGNAQGAADNYVLASDFATLQRQIDSATSGLERKGDTINAGLCDGFYAMNSTLLNGFSGAELSRANGNAAIMAQLNNNAMNEMQITNALSAQLSNCCCENRAATSDLKYTVATSARDITDVNNAGTQAILSKLCEMENSRKDEKIAEQSQQIFNLQLAASQANQNNYLIERLQPTPVPAYSASNLYGYYNRCSCV